MVFLVIPMVFWTFSWNEPGPHLYISPEPRETLRELQFLVRHTMVAGESLNPEVSLASVNRLIDQLDSQIRQGTQHWVDRSGSNLEEFEVDGFSLFGKVPRLPPETKDQGRWSFQPVVFQLTSTNLLVHAIALKATKTIRLQKVTLHFTDGPEHAFLFADDGGPGNGSPFEKRTYLPWMRLNNPQGQPRVRKLKSIEILGSAQDGNFSALLDFKFLAPGMDALDPTDILEATARLQRYWKTPASAARNFPATLQTLAFLQQRIPQ